jgi:hypothetical protein
MFDALFRVIKDSGKALELVAMPDGSRLALLPYGARVLGLFAPKDDDNFYWTNPVLDKVETARKMFAAESWHNTGGDRTWIAPEIDTFFTDATYSKFWQPRQLDMSDYAVECIGGGCRMSREMTLHLVRPNSDVRFRLSKWFGPAANPLRRERDMAEVASSVRYAGYSQRVSLQLLDGPVDFRSAVGIWNLMQLPPGGEMLVPLYSRAALQKCFGNVPDDHIKIDDHLLRIDADFPGSHKIAVKAASICGRTGYVYHSGEEWSLLMRNFFVNPSAEYVDTQRHDPEDFGYAFQMCRVDEIDFGSFCEMEYHAPAVGSLPDPTYSEDNSHVWAFRGGKSAIACIAKKLLGVNL